MREAIYAQQQTGEYPTKPDEWLRASTDAIDSVVSLKHEVSNLASLSAARMQDVSLNKLWASVDFSLAGIVLAVVGWFSVQRATNRIDGIQKSLTNGTENRDLTVRLSADETDELGAMAAAYNTLSAQIEAASSMGSVARQTQQSIKVQRAGTSEVTANIDQMIGSIKDVAEHSRHGSAAANQARQQAQTGLDVTQEGIASISALANDIRLAEKVIHRLEAENAEIGGIVAVICGIADQTNLLALNAAIEAARAGKSGRDFAVVADEVRNLASRTQESTHQIEDIIDRFKNSTDEAVVAMKRSNKKAADSVSRADETGTAFNSIAESVNAITEINGRIAQATDKQVSVFSSLSENMRANIQQFEQLSSDSSEKTRQSGTLLGKAVEDLQATFSTLRLQRARAFHV